MTVHYLQEDISFSFNKPKHLAWLEKCFTKLGLVAPDITYVFCSDRYLTKINQDRLGHDYKTDVITFDNRLKAKDSLYADIFISIETVKSNSVVHETSFENELRRVMVHGVLHLCGFNDKKNSEEQEMRRQEDLLLSLNY